MAASDKYYHGEITSDDTDWGGDASTGGKPCGGDAVQAYLKRKLSEKAGVFYYDEASNLYLVFSDGHSRDLYLENPADHADLVLGRFEAPAPYTASLTVLDSYITALNGTTGLYLEYTFDIQNKQGASVGDSVNVVYTFRNGGTKKEVKASYAAGTHVQFLMDDYLSVGQNTVTIAITGQSTLAATSQMVTVVIVDLQLTSTFDFSKAVSPSGTLTIPYQVEGAGVKTVEAYIDGVVRGRATGLVGTQTGNIYVNLSDIGTFGSGLHTLQLRASVVSDATTYYSPTLFYHFVATGGTDSHLLFAAKLDGAPVEGTSLTVGCVQYEETVIGWAYYSPDGGSAVVTFTAPDGGTANYTAVSGEPYTWSYTPVASGSLMVTVSGGGVTATIGLDVAASPLGIAETTEGLLVRLTAAGRSNNETERDKWKYEGVNYMQGLTNFEWNNQSGWYGGALVVKKGSGLHLSVLPFEGLTPGVLSGRGVTIDIDYSTSDVDDEDAVVIRCGPSDGSKGLVVTATEASLTTDSGVSVGTRFKPMDRQRLALTIHRTANTTPDYGLMTIVNNGLLERATAFDSTDQLTHNGGIYIGSPSATVRIYSIRVYETDLTVEQCFANYAVGAGNSRQIVNENDVYDDNGQVSYDKVRGMIPTFVFTGDMARLLAAAEGKNTTVNFDVDYHNPQAPEFDFTITHARVRPQGTSSLSYPIKNIRLYSSKDDCVMRDAQGNVIEGGKYSFKDGAQPVDCWTLKADYAESSMSHNTGTARLWNDLMKNVQIDGLYVCRTLAMQAAIDEDYEYDVRVAIDGFPCCVFYRQSESEPLTFMGQFNFNNDKSTESVFGFKDVPGFDNSDVECWESLNNSDSLALFIKSSDFYDNQIVEGKTVKRWTTAFEARYPDDGENADTTGLKEFADWMVSMNGKPSQFATEKWEHMDVYKMAAYYTYFMRHGAVDQTVKNSMLTTEGMTAWRPVTSGGVTTIQKETGSYKKYFYTFYDNDTIHGINNDSRLIFDPYIDRTSPDPLTPSAKAYAGSTSVLWNMLEGDTEFMSIVRQMDQALTRAGLTYKHCCEIYDDGQSAAWPARIYNASQRYKYIDQYRKGSNLLRMLQGARTSHRHWWMKTRFDLYDSRYVSGSYRSSYITFKAEEQTGFISSFKITAGDPLYYAYGINNIVYEVTSAKLQPGQDYTFDLERLERPLVVGDPVNIYGASHLAGVDLSNYAHLLSSLEFTSVNDADSGSRFKTLILGNAQKVNSRIVSLNMNDVPTLEKLDIVNFTGLTTLLNLDALPNLHELYAAGSGLTAFAPANGVTLTNVSLPSSLTALALRGATVGTLSYAPTSTLLNVTLDGVAGMDTKAFVTQWLAAIGSGSYASRSLSLGGIDWEDVDAGWLCGLKEKGWASFAISGHAKVSGEITAEAMTRVENNFGSGCFSPDAAFYVELTPGLYVTAPASAVEGSSVTLRAQILPTPTEAVSYTWSKSGDGRATLSATTGSEVTLDVSETGAADGTATVTVVARVGTTAFSQVKTVSIVRATYPTDAQLTLAEESRTASRRTYRITSSVVYTGALRAEWSLTGDITACATLTGSGMSAVLEISSTPVYAAGTVQCVLKKGSGTTLTTKTLSVAIADATVAITKEENPNVMALMYAKQLCANENYMTKQECADVTDSDVQPGTAASTSIFYANSAFRNSTRPFQAFQYFTGLTKLSTYLFSECRFSSIILPPNITSIETRAMYRTSLLKIDIPDGVTTIGQYAFAESAIKTIELPTTLGTIAANAFFRCGLTAFEAPVGCTTIQSAFQQCASLKTVKISATVTSISANCFGNCTALESITVDTANGIYDSRNDCNAIIATSTNTLVQGCKNTVIPSSVTAIGTQAFLGMPFTNLVIPEGVRTIGLNAMNNCSALARLTLPSTLTTIGDRAFVWCNLLADITIKRATAPALSSFTFGSASLGYTGSSVTGDKYIHVLSNATGYDASYWASVVTNQSACNYILDATL